MSIGERQVARHVTGAFVDRAWDLTGRLARTASRLERASIAVMLACAIAHEAILIDTPTWCRKAAVILLQRLAAGANVSVALMIVGEVGTCEAAVAADRF